MTRPPPPRHPVIIQGVSVELPRTQLNYIPSIPPPSDSGFVTKLLQLLIGLATAQRTVTPIIIFQLPSRYYLTLRHPPKPESWPARLRLKMLYILLKKNPTASQYFRPIFSTNIFDQYFRPMLPTATRQAHQIYQIIPSKSFITCNAL
jgi:hypothetical protein